MRGAIATSPAVHGTPSFTDPGIMTSDPAARVTTAPLHADVTPLSGMCVVSTALNLPGPLACQRLRGLGATVVKIEPPRGDPMRTYVPAWYAELAAGQTVERLDLKAAEGRERLAGLLVQADLLVTSQRPSARARLGLDDATLVARFPRLCGVHIVGSVAEPERPGHDLTYQAALDLLSPPGLPRTLLADIAGAERAAQCALALLLARERGGKAAHLEVGLQDAAEPFALPWRHGATRPGGMLGGGFAGYAIYRTADGWVAVGALEPHFHARLGAVLGVPQDDTEAIQRAFAARPNVAWAAVAREHDLPITALPGR
jgi:alpha-methylacyl-CoA racemase